MTAALTDFADAAVGAAVRFILTEATRRRPDRARRPGAPDEGSGWIILGMGKFGAGELNYSSDIDLIVLFDREVARVMGDRDPTTVFVKLTKRLVHILQERTADGYVFRTDLRLRPDPGATNIAMSTDAALQYYESLGQNWERAALIKARPVAGDKQAGDAFLAELTPYIWRKYLDYAAIADIHSIKRQIHDHRGHEEIAVAGHNIKLGRGGIREIEFFVQTQQLIAGGRNPELRGRRHARHAGGARRRRLDRRGGARRPRPPPISPPRHRALPADGRRRADPHAAGGRGRARRHRAHGGLRRRHHLRQGTAGDARHGARPLCARCSRRRRR